MVPDYDKAVSPGDSRFYAAQLSGPPKSRKPAYQDITEIVDGIAKRTLGSLESSMQARVSALSSGERANVFSLKPGPATKLLRNTVAWYSKGVGEKVIGSEAMFGPNPWVHVIQRDGGHALVEAANADAARASVAAAYEIRKSLGDVHDEVKAGGRPMVQEYRDDNGKLVGFVAGPSPTDPRFQGTTHYYKSAVPEFVSLFGDGVPPDWTAAFGELDQFWVDTDDLAPLDAGALDKYAPAKQP